MPEAYDPQQVRTFLILLFVGLAVGMSVLTGIIYAVYSRAVRKGEDEPKDQRDNE